jgi:antitoxin ParD1/3/4
MHIALTPALERLIDAKVASGRYETASEVVREALQLLEKRDQAREQLRTDVQAGFDELARGDGHVYDKTMGRSLTGRIKLRGRSARTKTSSG